MSKITVGKLREQSTLQNSEVPKLKESQLLYILESNLANSINEIKVLKEDIKTLYDKIEHLRITKENRSCV